MPAQQYYGAGAGSSLTDQSGWRVRARRRTATGLLPPPNATRAWPGCATWCASRAGPTCGGGGLGRGVELCDSVRPTMRPPPPAPPHKACGEALPQNKEKPQFAGCVAVTSNEVAWMAMVPIKVG